MKTISDRLALDVGGLVFVTAFFSILAGLGLYAMCLADLESVTSSRRLREKTHNELISRAMSMELKILFTDLKIAAAHLEVRQFLETRSPESRRKAELEFINLCRISGNYDQVRILDTKGMEIIRVNYNNGEPATVAQDKLQDKGDRYYFKESIALPPGKVYVSPFDLNIENGQIEQPLKPMIRVGTPVVDDSGRVLGVVLLNYLGKRLLEDLDHATGGFDNAMLVNMDGYWLRSPDPGQEWAFMYEDRGTISFANEHPEAWKVIREFNKGLIPTAQGEYAFSTIAQPSDGLSESALGKRQWKLICLTPQFLIDQEIASTIAGYYRIGAGVFCIILFGAVTRARSRYNHKKYMLRLEKARHEADHANRAKSDFLARMSHEIRTPMNAIIGMTHLAQKTNLDSKQSDYLNKISISAQVLLGIINDILDFSKIEADKLEVDEVDFLLDDVLNRTINMLGLQAERKGLEFLLYESKDLPNRLKGDPLRLGQILVNIIGNAIKFTEEGSVIVSVELVEMIDRKTLIRFSVKDTGIGISEESRRKLFKPFSQADGSITRQFGGTGLGLTISKLLAEKMGGTLELESELGKGSEFIITLPFEVQLKQSSQDKMYPEFLVGARVLVVDDKQISRFILREMLESFALDVTEAENAAEALELVHECDREEDAFRIVVTDWRMPDMDGLELSRKIKKSRTLKVKPRIIMVTAYGQEDVLFQAKQVDLDGFMLKPVNRSILFDNIMDAFAGDREVGVRLGEKGAEARIPQNVVGSRILLAEDNVINQQVAREILEDAGVEVCIANNGQEAVEMVAETEFDAILMDIQMPKMDGLEATRAIRSGSCGADIPIIAMTAHALVGDKEKSHLAGMDDHVTKPIDPDNLLAVLSRYIVRDAATGGESGNRSSREDVCSGDSIPLLPGIDINKGLSRVRGNKELYRKLLTSFAEECGQMGDDLVRLAGGEDHDRARMVAHSLKGVAGNVGADELQHILQSMEASFRKSMKPPSSTMAMFNAERAMIIQGVRQELGENYQAETEQNDLVDREAIAALLPQLEKLLELLKMNDFEARQLFESLQSELDVVAPDLIREIGMLLDKFDFSAGRAKVESLILQMQKDGEM